MRVSRLVSCANSSDIRIFNVLNISWTQCKVLEPGSGVEHGAYCLDKPAHLIVNLTVRPTISISVDPQWAKFNFDRMCLLQVLTACNGCVIARISRELLVLECSCLVLTDPRWIRNTLSMALQLLRATFLADLANIPGLGRPNSSSQGPVCRSFRLLVKWKALKCKPVANCACAILLIDGLGYLYAFTCGLPLVAREESDTG